MQIDKYLFVIAANWSTEEKNKHHVLREEEMSINLMLKKFIEDSTKPSSNTFKKFTEITYLVKPNHLLTKPIFACMILKQTLPDAYKIENWKDYNELHKLWAKSKH